METKQSNNSATPMADAVKIANQRALFSLEWENDTVFKKRELNYKTKAAFQKDLEAGKISKYTTVFIKDSKEIYKNGQYYGAGSSSVVDISDIIGRLSKIEGSGKVEQSDYDNLKKYISEGKILVCNSLEDSDTTTSCNVSYYFDGNNITISANIKYGTMGVLYSEYLISNDLSISKSTSITPFTGYVSECNLSEKYKKSDSYTPITSSDSIEKAIGKLEASVSSEDFILDLSKYKQSYGVKFNLNPEDLEGVKLAINNKRKILIKANISSISGSTETEEGVLIPVASLQNKDGIFCQYKCKMQYLMYEDTITITILTSTGECTAFYSTNLILPSKNGDISIFTALEGVGEASAQSSIELKKSGNGTKFLSDDGTYKDSNIYFLPEKILDLERESTSDDFLAVFGSIDNLKDVLNKSLNGKILAVKRNSTALKHGGTQTISTNVLQFAQAYLVSLRYFIPKTATDMSTIFREIEFVIDSKAKISSFNIKDAYHGGYRIPANIYILSDKSTSDDILRVFGTGDSFKKLILAIIDGNRILINGTPRDGEEVTNTYGEYINNVETIACKIFDNGNMTLTLKIFLCAYIAVQTSILIVEYNKSENKFSCKINNI